MAGDRSRDENGEVELGLRDDQGLLDPEPEDLVELQSALKQAYRKDIERKRSMLLLILLIPVMLIILLWHLFDSNSKIGPGGHSSQGASNGTMTLDQYRNQVHQGYDDPCETAAP
ncbi:hypothetical protein KFL_007490060 [Klebsormidium nitens]|uniref:Uncharacterized protein n=1 Tax=Klebsormidium nitens TaxID=105231 RepID=A0A1Y1IRH1_KLENI|nr:hypothetical protein KFL_007490060 [Klebsormidium nitens]|eukprot:GAQ91237.1 hypothetical protein KFL_007490060 [Klebsormidium nitens]